MSRYAQPHDERQSGGYKRWRDYGNRFRGEDIQEMKRKTEYTMTFISVCDSGLRYLDEVLHAFTAEKESRHLFQNRIRTFLYFVGEQKDHSTKLGNIEESILASDIIFLDLMGADRFLTDKIDGMIKNYKKDLVLIGSGSEYQRSRIRLGSFSFNMLKKMMSSEKDQGDKQTTPPIDMQKMFDRMEVLGKIIPVGPLKDMRNSILIGKFWRYACYENIKNMVVLVLRRYGKIKELPKPGNLIDYSKYVLFDPEKLTGFKTLAQLKEKWGWNDSLNTVGVLFHNFNYPNYSFGVLSRIINSLRAKYNVVPFGIPVGSKPYGKINKIIDKGLMLDLLWDFLPFRFGAGPMGGDVKAGLDIFKRLNVPVMHPFFLGKRKISDWEETLTGLNPMELIVQIMLPELDGIVETIPVAALENKPGDTLDNLSQLCIVEHRLEKLFDRSKSYITLRNRKNKNKRIAFILYNYPPGEGNVGGASFLDCFKSIERITGKMKEAGYNCSQISALKLEEIFMNRGVCNSSEWSDSNSVKNRYELDKYLQDMENPLNKFMIKRVSEEWGNSPGKIMANDVSFFIPGIMEKNLFVGLQPSRGTLEFPSKLYHDKELVPHHQYLAFYRWLENEFRADAVVHVGTHGTLEFLPGKESALSNKCFPDYLIGKMAHFYLYYIGNPSEATIAKRRTYGCLISYSGPLFIRSGAYGDYVTLENMINEYLEAGIFLPQKKSELINKIKDKTTEMKLIVDGEFTVDNISKELIRLKSSLMPAGLHEIGKPFDEREKQSFLNAILCWNRGDILSVKEIVESEYDNLRFLNSETCSDNSLIKEDRIYEIGDALIKSYFFGDKNMFNIACDRISSDNRKYIHLAMCYGEKCLERIESTDEINGLLNALDGNYVMAGLGGDLIRDPEVFPTGYNMYQFDPRLVPSDTAMSRGKKIANSTIEFYLKEHKKYPESVAVVLWGLETSRTRGETIGQILAYLGVKLDKRTNSWENKIEIIPLDKLDRPRIDCVITICGFFRDMFPNMIDLLDEIYEVVSSLEEPFEANFVRKHSDKFYRDMKKDVDEALAGELSRARIFGPPEGQYGTGITTMIEGMNWEDEVEIANAYLKAQKHVYTRSGRCDADESLFKKNLEVVDLVSQVRSSVDYSFMDLDHYYEYFGGLAKSVEEVKGKKPEMIVTDSSTNIIYTDEARKAIEIGVRTRLLNPEYIREMLKHRVHGAQQIAKRVENLIGLSATTGRVESWIFDEIKRTYFDDRNMFGKLKENNQFATADIIKRLLEAQKRGYWDAEEDEIKELQNIYLELEGSIEDLTE